MWLGHHFQGQKVKGQGPGRFIHRGLNASDSCSGQRGNVFGVGNYCYVAVCSATVGASAPTEGVRGGGISWRPPAYSLLMLRAFWTISAIGWSRCAAGGSLTCATIYWSRNDRPIAHASPTLLGVLFYLFNHQSRIRSTMQKRKIK